MIRGYPWSEPHCNIASGRVIVASFPVRFHLSSLPLAVYGCFNIPNCRPARDYPVQTSSDLLDEFIIDCNKNAK